MDLKQAESIAECHERAKANSLQLADAYEEYTKKYPRKWIAASDGVIYGPADSIKEMFQILEREGADVVTVDLEYLNPDRLDPNIIRRW